LVLWPETFQRRAPPTLGPACHQWDLEIKCSPIEKQYAIHVIIIQNIFVLTALYTGGVHVS
jgi:hypothetical protein